MIRMFERIALLTAGGLVSGMVAAAILYPPEQTTARPTAVLAQPKSTGVASRAPVAVTVAAVPKQRFLPIKARGSETLLSEVSVRKLDAHDPVPDNSAENLARTFSEMGYDLDSVRSGDQQVPRVFLASIPYDLAELRQVQRKKSLFFKTVLPLILQVNEEIRQDRARLWKLQTRLNKGEKLAARDRLWLIVMAERYKVKRGNIPELIKRADIIPVSLALAQAAEESGWGTSRFAREANAMFGQWTTADGVGLVPKNRDDGKTHKIRSFKSLLHSARAYARNLNTHRAYRKMRIMRQQLRQQGVPIQGHHLVETLTSYSERGEDYVKGLRAIIAVNKLRHLDRAELNNGA
ncbi:MAG: glucosaminidase domain-containing protein [Rhodospirillales bacterium]|nr:glucosaminidase domain-containing protein [Rhodospirillales bacterium]